MNISRNDTVRTFINIALTSGRYIIAFQVLQFVVGQNSLIPSTLRIDTIGKDRTDEQLTGLSHDCCTAVFQQIPHFGKLLRCAFVILLADFSCAHALSRCSLL